LGNSPLSELWNIGFGKHIYAIATGDVNGDSINDVAVTIGHDDFSGTEFVVLSNLSAELWRKSFTSEGPRLLIIANLTGDARQDLVTTTSVGGSMVRAYDSDGNLLWQDNLITFVDGVNKANFNGDALDDIVAGTWGQIKAWTNNGFVLWNYAGTSFSSAPADIGNLNGDLLDDVIVRTNWADGRLHALSSSGSVLWQYGNPGSSRTGSFANLDADALDEVIGPGIPQGSSTADQIFALDSDGSVLWTRSLAVESFAVDSISVPPRIVAFLPGELHVLDAVTGATLLIKTTPADPAVFSAAVVGRLSSNGSHIVSFDEDKVLRVRDASGNLIAEQPIPDELTVPNPSGDIRLTIKLADITGDGFDEILFGAENLHAFQLPLDTTPPVIDKTITGTLGNNDWYTSDVTVTWTVTDPESSVTIDSGCGTQTFTTDTVSVTSSCSAHSAGGSASDSVTLKIDQSPPSAMLSVTAGTLGSNGWYTSDVTVHTSGTDSISSPVTCTSDQIISTETTGTVVTGSCTNDAGLSTNAAPLTVKLDKTGPSATLAVSDGTLGTNGWYISDITIRTSGSDDISSPVTCTPDQHQTTETPGTVFNGSCTNDAGLTTDAAPLTVKLDKTPPSVKLTAPNGGEVLFVPRTFTITWNSCADALSGPATNAITLHYSTNNGANWISISMDGVNDSSYDWNMPGDLDSASMRVKITCADHAGNTANDVSDNPFTATLGLLATKDDQNARTGSESLYEAGDSIEYTITLQNRSKTITLQDHSDPEFTDAIADMILIPNRSCSASSGKCTYDARSRTYSWNGEIPPSGVVTIRILARIPAGLRGESARRVCNQGTVKVDFNGDGTPETTVQTDDPDTSAATDSTCLDITLRQDIGRDRPFSLEKLEAYWLPKRDAFQFEALGTGIKAISVYVFSLKGERIHQSGWVANGHEWRLEDRTGRKLANGVYLYVISVQGYDDEKSVKTQVKKLTIGR
jgi:hypothetical protein